MFTDLLAVLLDVTRSDDRASRGSAVTLSLITCNGHDAFVTDASRHLMSLTGSANLRKSNPKKVCDGTTSYIFYIPDDIVQITPELHNLLPGTDRVQSKATVVWTQPVECIRL